MKDNVQCTKYHCPRCHTINDVFVEFHPERSELLEGLLRTYPKVEKGIKGLFQDYSMEVELWKSDYAYENWYYCIVCPVCGNIERIYEEWKT